MSNQESIFTGLKVLEIASFIAGPSAATILSDFGAEIVKLEPPGIGDPYRYFYLTPPNPPLKENYTWQLTNRNKKSIVVDLKNPKAEEILRRLVSWADVFVTNFPPHVRKKLKLSYEDISSINPRLIYASITGYGEAGPEADKPGFDITAYWARSGLMQFTREASSPPAVPVPGIGDHATAVSLYASIVTGLYRRERTGEGCEVATSLIAEGAWATAAWLQAGLFGAKFSGEIDRANPPNAIAGASYKTLDNRWVLLVFVEEDKNWPVFARAVGHEDWISDVRFAEAKSRHKNSRTLVAELDKLFVTQPLSYWKKLLDDAMLPYGVVQIPEEILKDPQLMANQIIVPIEEENETPRYTVNSPINVKQSPKIPPKVAPTLGEHTKQVLEEIGYDEASIEALKKAGVITLNEKK